jgi:hypothetical protein
MCVFILGTGEMRIWREANKLFLNKKHRKKRKRHLKHDLLANSKALRKIGKTKSAVKEIK